LSYSFPSRSFIVGIPDVRESSIFPLFFVMRTIVCSFFFWYAGQACPFLALHAELFNLATVSSLKAWRVTFLAILRAQCRFFKPGRERDVLPPPPLREERDFLSSDRLFFFSFGARNAPFFFPQQSWRKCKVFGEDLFPYRSAPPSSSSYFVESFFFFFEGNK